MVDHPVLHEDHPPEHGHGHASAQNGRQVIQAAVNADSLDFRVQQDRDEQREGQLQRHGEKGVETGDLHGGQELFVRGKQRQIIFQPHKLRLV